MPTNKNAHLRFRILDSLFSSGRTFSKKEILEKISDELGYGISASTLDHDIQFLRDLRAPIEYETRNGYYYSDKKFRIFSSSLDQDESSALDFAYEALNTLDNVELAEEAQSVLLSIRSRMSQQEDKSGKKIIYRPPTPPVKGLEWLPELYKAIKQEKAITVKYYKLQTKEIKTHTLSPYILRQYNDMWYVVAWSAGRELTLVFALDRIREIKPANVSYFKDPKFDADQYFKYSFGITHSHYELPQKVVFWVSKEAFYYLQVRPLHASQKVMEEKEDGTIIQMEVIISEELVMALMGLGRRIKVLGPDLLARRIMKEIEAVKAL